MRAMGMLFIQIARSTAVQRGKKESALIDMFGVTYDVELPVLIPRKNRTILSDFDVSINSRLLSITPPRKFSEFFNTKIPYDKKGL